MGTMTVLVLNDANQPNSGTFYPVATSGIFATHDSGKYGHTGSWGGLANTWGGDSTASGSYENSVTTGSWYGLDNTYGVSQVLSETYDRSVISDENPVANQSIGSGEWDFFPIPESPPEPELPERDTTRYRKSYSSQRHQPRRIRYIKR